MTPRRTYLLSINTLACSKAEIENMNLSYLAQNHSSVTRLKNLLIDVRCAMLLNFNSLT